MTVTPASFKTFFDPVFDDADEGVLQTRIDEAERRTNRTAWGSRADDGISYLVAHALAVSADLASGAAARGPLTSETMGPESRSYAAPTAAPYTQAWYGLSGYGQAYQDLRALVFADRVGDL